MFWMVTVVVVAGVLVMARRFDKRHGLRVGTGTRNGRGIDPTYGASAGIFGGAPGHQGHGDGGHASCGDGGGSSC